MLASGNLGLIYLMEESRRLMLEEIEERHPDLIPALIGHPHVGFVMVHSRDHGPVVLSALGASYLAEQRIVGDDPLAPFSANAAHHLRRTDGFTNAPDILVNSFFDPLLEEGCAFEELISFHGGLGGPQTRPFILHPVALEVPDEPIVGAAHVHEVLLGWRDGAAAFAGEPGAAAGIGDARELMPAVDQRLLRASPAGRTFLVACVPLGVATALTIVVQATLIGHIVEDVFLDHRRARGGCRRRSRCSPRLPLARGVFAWAFEAGGHLTASATVERAAPATRAARPRRSARRPCDDERRRHDRRRQRRRRARSVLRALPAAARAGRRRAARDPRCGSSTLDVVSAVVMAVTLPLIPIFGILVGPHDRPVAPARATPRWPVSRATSSTSCAA